METREDLKSILPFLPVVLQSSSLLWPSRVVECLTTLSRGPEHSRVDSGEVLFVAISDLRDSLGLSSEHLADSVGKGYAHFFDELMSRVESRKWFSEVLPSLAVLLLRLPSLLEIHYQNADNILCGIKTGLRLIGRQKAGIVFLSQVSHSGLIEDQLCESLEVDFANKYIGGGALRRGCVQEEIRFMINPELIAGMLFLPSMANNEAIEIFGAERFSNHTGYASSFRFVGDYVDEKPVDFMGRRKTRIVAIDALRNPRMRQYKPECLLRETNKAFCGFFDQSKQHLYQDAFQVEAFCGNRPAQEVEGLSDKAQSVQMEKPLSSAETLNDGEQSSQAKEPQNDIGIVTGNWGCGAFQGDPELKSIIQWLAASQAFRPFILYCTFGVETLQNIEQVTQWIVLHEWTVGDLWNILSEYSSQRMEETTNTGFFTWLKTCCSMMPMKIVSLDDLQINDRERINNHLSFR